MEKYEVIEHPQTVLKLQSLGAIVIDARAKQSYDEGHIPGAKHMYYIAHENSILDTFPDKNAVYVTYCSNRQCPSSSMFAEKMHNMGYNSVFEYINGFDDWQQSGMAIETG